MKSTEITFWAPSIWVKILTQLLCIGAIELCCQRQLARYIAYKRATPPTSVVKVTPKPSASKSRWEIARSALISLVAIALPLSGFLGKARYISQSGVDAGLALVMVHCWSTDFASALYGVIPRNRSVYKVRGTGHEANKWVIKITPEEPTTGFSWQNESVNQGAGLLCALILLGSSYLGSSALFPLACGSQVIWGLIGWCAAKITMRTMVYLQISVMTLCIALGVLITTTSHLHKKARTAPPEEIFGQPSGWLFQIMTLLSYNMAYILIGAFMQVNMRYEYTRTASPALPSSPGEGVDIDYKAAKPSLPLHTMATVTLIACCAVTDLLDYFGIIKDAAVGVIVITMSSLPAVVLVSALYTLARGDFKSWWNYVEVYREEIDFDQVEEMDEDGKVISTVSEKARPVTP